MAIDTGTYGAKRVSFKDDNPRPLLLAIIENNPALSDEEIKAVFRRRVSRKQADACLDYFVDNTRQALRRAALDPVVHEAKVAVRRTEDARVACSVRQSFLSTLKSAYRSVVLDQTMPNGKALRDCTGVEAVAFGKAAIVANEIVVRIGNAAGSRRVGDVVSETEADNIAKG